MPQSKLGKWSVWLIAAFLVLLGVGMMLVSLGQRGGETIFDNLLLSIPMLLAGAAGIASFVVGLISIIRSKERHVLVIIATVIGFIVAFFIAGEIISPH